MRATGGFLFEHNGGCRPSASRRCLIIVVRPAKHFLSEQAGGPAHTRKASGRSVPLPKEVAKRTAVCPFATFAMQNEIALSPNHSRCTCQPEERWLREGRKILQAVIQALNVYLESDDCLGAGRLLLQSALQHTQSQAGCLGVAVEGENVEFLARAGVDPDRPILVHAMRSRSQLITSAYLAVPLFKGTQRVGTLALANREGGYRDEDLISLQPIHSAAAILCDIYRHKVQRQHLEEQRTRLEVEFRQAQKMEVLGQLAGGIAHDFNNSLMVLSGSADLLERALPPGSPAAPYLEQIRRTTDKAAMVTKQLLAFSRKQVLDVKPIDVHEVLDDCEFMLPQLLGSGVQLTFRRDATHSWIRADATQLEQVLVNLAVNARDAMSGGGALTVSTRDEQTETAASAKDSSGFEESTRWIVLEVQDSGCGMDEQTRAHIFEPFFTTKPVGKGTGLGLSTVYGIVSQFGGRVEVDSQPGRGTCFKLSFPVAAPLCAEAPQTAISGGPAAKADRLTILLVDDEASLCMAIAEFLRDAGHHVLDSVSPADALEIARHTQSIDVLLTDMVMPGLRGTQLANEIQKLHPETHVIFMSGYAQGLPEVAIPPGAKFLQKPFRFSYLLEQLTLVRRRQ